MSQTTRKIFAIILLVLLLGLPFIDWKLGALLWMCAWLIFIFQNLFPRHNWKFGDEDETGDDQG
jgi:hypothetical protein